MSLKIIFSALAVCMQATTCTAQFEFINGGSTCAGINDQNYLETAFGPCDEGEEVKSTFFIVQNIEEMAVICDISKYSDDANERSDITPYEENGEFTFAFRREAEQTNGDAGCEFGVNQMTVKMADSGDPNGGGYVSTAAYISTGPGACTTNTNNVVKPVKGGCFEDCEQTEGICIMDDVAGTACTGAKTFETGTTKFSVMLLTDTGYTQPSQCLGGGTTVSNIGVRVKYDFSSMGTGATVTFNDDKTAIGAMGQTQVKSVTVNNAEGTKGITIDFPNGITHGSKNGDDYDKTNNGVVGIQAHSNGATSFYIDLLFDINFLNQANTWVAYDPNVRSTGGSIPNSASSVTTNVVVVALGALFAMMSL